MINPHGKQCDSSQPPYKHHQDNHQLSGTSQLRRDARGQSHSAEGRDHLKKSWMKSYSGSKMHIKNVAMHTTPPERIVIMLAFDRTDLGMLLRNEESGFLANTLFVASNNTKNVLVLIPPPVDPGEAPINIKMQRTNNPALVKLPIGYVEKPAVLADTLWKNAPIHVIFSVAFKEAYPRPAE